MWGPRFVLCCLALGSLAQAAPALRVRCLPVQHPLLRGASAAVFGINDPLHCEFLIERSGGRCDLFALLGSAVETPVVHAFDSDCELPQIAGALAYDVKGCDIEQLREAIAAYGDDRYRVGPNTANENIETGFREPHGYGPPEYCDSAPFAMIPLIGESFRGGCATSNTFIAWSLRQCGVSMAAPPKAVGWDAQPTWYGPKDAETRRRETIWPESVVQMRE